MKSRDFRKLNESIDFSVTKSYEDEQGRTVHDMSHFVNAKMYSVGYVMEQAKTNTMTKQYVITAKGKEIDLSL